MKRIIGLGWLGWSKIALGFSRLGHSAYQAGIIASHSAGKRAKSLGAKR